MLQDPKTDTNISNQSQTNQTQQIHDTQNQANVFSEVAEAPETASKAMQGWETLKPIETLRVITNHKNTNIVLKIHYNSREVFFPGVAEALQATTTQMHKARRP